MAFRIPLLASLALGACLTAQAQSTTAPSAPAKPTAASAPAAPAATDADKKAAAKKAAKKAPAKDVATKDAPKKAEPATTTTAKAGTTLSTGPKELRDKDGKVIPTDPAAYPIDSALPRKK